MSEPRTTNDRQCPECLMWFTPVSEFERCPNCTMGCMYQCHKEPIDIIAATYEPPEVKEIARKAYDAGYEAEGDLAITHWQPLPPPPEEEEEK